MGWGQVHEPSPSPAATTGTTRQIADAAAALATVGVHRDNLALSALEAAGQIDRLRHLLTRLLRESGHGERFAIHDEVARNLNQLTAGPRSVPPVESANATWERIKSDERRRSRRRWVTHTRVLLAANCFAFGVVLASGRAQWWNGLLLGLSIAAVVGVELSANAARDIETAQRGRR